MGQLNDDVIMIGSQAVAGLGAEGDEGASCVFDGCSCQVRGVLPVSDSCIPPVVLVRLHCPLSQRVLVHPPSVGRVIHQNGLDHHQLVEGHSQGADLGHCSPVELGARGTAEQFGVGVVLGVALVVELDEVEVDEAADLLVDGDVAALGVVGVLEVGGLRAVSDNPVGNDSSQCLRELYKPVLADAVLHSSVVLPVYVSPVQVVVDYEVSQLGAAHHWVFVVGGGELGGSERAHHNFDASVVVDFLHAFLHDLVGGSPGVGISDVHGDVLPDKCHVFRVVVAAPEREDDVVVIVEGGVPGQPQVRSHVHPVPVNHAVDVHSAHGVVVGRDGRSAGVGVEVEGSHGSQQQQTCKQVFHL